MSRTRIRLYQHNDKAACLAIFDSNVPQYFVPGERNEFIQWLNKPGRAPYYVFEAEQETVGCGGIYVDKDKQIAGLAWGMVHRNYHKKGLGRSLTLYRLKAMTLNYPTLEQHLETSQYTEAFYQQFGFQTYERIKNGFSPGLDNCKMKRVHK